MSYMQAGFNAFQARWGNPYHPNSQLLTAEGNTQDHVDTNNFREKDGTFSPMFLERSAAERRRVIERVRADMFKRSEGRCLTVGPIDERRLVLSDTTNQGGGNEFDRIIASNTAPRASHTGWKSSMDALTFYATNSDTSVMIGEVIGNWRYLRASQNIYLHTATDKSIYGKHIKGDVDGRASTHNSLIGRGYLYAMGLYCARLYIKLDSENRLTSFYQFDQHGFVTLAIDDRDQIWDYELTTINTLEWVVGAAMMYTLDSFDFRGQPTISESRLDRSGNMALSAFYPWFKDDIPSYFQEFMESDENVLLFLGKPGTGKSTFIRTGLQTNSIRSLLCVNAEAFMNENFLGLVNEMFKSNKIDVVVIEDADIFVRKREENNLRMAGLLNMTNGIDQSIRAKFILTTNLESIVDVDEALLRPGRCFDYMYFGTLTCDEAVELRVSMKKPPKDFKEKERYTLAEVMSSSDVSGKNKGIVKPRHGRIE